MALCSYSQSSLRISCPGRCNSTIIGWFNITSYH
ncbi:hypothetical protein NP493_265g00009 [Ridgeia piscesae]|uniref:Uncharacterized protein n=1 Tax=Ridgeia piscesae TaxID=27915 RepID=A0AAD9UCJ7_RIDPI|nr:hypothetical protein NP493_265g00009 [Ridgeia piscesae]